MFFNNLFQRFVWLFPVFFLLLTFSSSQPACALTLRIDNPKIDLVLLPGDTSSGFIGVDNPEDVTVQVRVYAEDWVFKGTGTGEKDFYAPGIQPQGAARWLKMNPVEFTLPPFGRREVNYTVSLPKEETMSGMYRAVIFFETAVGEATTDKGTKVLIAARIGTILAIEIKGTANRSGRIGSVETIPPKGNKPAEFLVTFENTGNVDIELLGNFLILDSEGSVKGRGELRDIYTHGGMRASRKSSWAGRLDPGAYDVIFTFDMGQGDLLTAEEKMVVE